MRPVLVVIAEVFVHEALQMALMENNHMIEQVATTGADPALGHAVLPRTAEAGSLGLDAEALYRADDFLVEIRAAIKDQIPRCGIVRKCLAQLLDHPCARWLPGHIEVKDAPPITSDDEEAVQHT